MALLHIPCTTPDYGWLALVTLPLGWVLFQLFWGKAPSGNRDGTDWDTAPGNFGELLFCLGVGLFIVWLSHVPC